MKKNLISLTLVFLLILSGCITSPKNLPKLNITPREIISPVDLSDSITREKIFWQNRFIYLDTAHVVTAPDSKFIETLKINLPPQYSHNGRYLVYRYGFFMDKIGVWDSEFMEHKQLIDNSTDLPVDSSLGGVAFTSSDEKILFSYTWHDEDQKVKSDLATVEVTTGKIEQLNISDLQISFFDLGTSRDNKWAALEMATLNNQVCLLIDLEKYAIKCLTIEKGWYHSPRFTSNSEQIAFSHRKEIDSPTSVMLSNLDGTNIQTLVSGFSIVGILAITDNEIIFGGATYKDPKCGNVYIINLDGSDLRKLSYLGGECSSDE